MKNNVNGLCSYAFLNEAVTFNYYDLINSQDRSIYSISDRGDYFRYCFDIRDFVERLVRIPENKITNGCLGVHQPRQIPLRERLRFLLGYPMREISYYYSDHRLHPYVDLYFHVLNRWDLLGVLPNIISKEDLYKLALNLRVKARLPLVQKKVLGINRAFDKIHAGMSDFHRAIFRRYPQIKIVSINLGYATRQISSGGARFDIPQSLVSAGGDGTYYPQLVEVKGHFKAFLKQLSKGYATRVGHIWKVHYMPTRGHLFHILAFFNGLEPANDAEIVQSVKSLWEGDITSKMGRARAVPLESPIPGERPLWGRGVIDRRDEKTRECLAGVIRYICAFDSHLRPEKVWKGRTMQRSGVKAVSKKRAKSQKPQSPLKDLSENSSPISPQNIFSGGKPPSAASLG